jgi:glycosyltransferase involved in cell wall biosynthesis
MAKAAGKLSYLPAMVRARRVVRSIAPDVVHAHYATSAGLAACISDYHPWVVTAHGTDVASGVQSIFWRALLRLIFKKADSVNAVSDELGESIVRLGVPRDKVEVFTLGIDTQQFTFSERNFDRLPMPLRLVCTRRIEPVYNHETLIRAIAVLKSRGLQVDLTIIGDGIQRGKIEQLVRDLELTDRIRFEGSLPNSALPRVLAQHDVYVSSSIRDGTSLCLLEAMASGLFPVVSDIRANTDWITQGKNGLLHKAADSEGLATCISRFLANPQVFSQALHSNRKLIVSRGDRATNMRRLEDIYRGLVLSQGSVRVCSAKGTALRGTVSAFRRN